MHNILIVGNITKDVYLRLDNRLNSFEQDQNQVDWLDFAFDGSEHHFYSRVSIYGGSSISLEVLSRFGIEASICGTSASFKDGQFFANDADINYHYILCKDEAISHLIPSSDKESSWETPAEAPGWIYLDYTATINAETSERILNYLHDNTVTKLAIFVSGQANQNIKHIHDLMERADLIFSDYNLPQYADKLVRISPKHITYGKRRVAWAQKNRDLVTQLSAYQTIAATILGAIELGRNPDDALLLARSNIIHAKLGSTLNLSTLEQTIINDQHYIEYKQEGNMTPEIIETTKKLMTPGKGILAADESGGSIHKKFESMGIPDDEQHRRTYRNLFFTTPLLDRYVSGVILFDETARQHADDGKDFVTFLRDRGIIAGIKVDQGLVNFENSEEKYTQGLDDLPQRLDEYYKMGARFAKWRAAFELTENTPSDMAIRKNCEILAQYAVDCQNASIVPIVEPELVYDGDYTIEQNIETTGKILDELFNCLREKNVELRGCILKVNMVLAGKRQAIQSSAEEVGEATAQTLREHVPAELGGVVFLSGGQTVQQATDNLQAVTNCGPFPWQVTFSFARALQDPALVAWHGDDRFSDFAREAFRQRLIANTEALRRK